MVYIIGSGLSAISAAVALVRRGCRPTILDAGLLPEPAALALKSKLAATEPEDWNSKDIAPLKRTGPVAASGIPRKLHFGSDFTFRQVEQAARLDIEQASMHRSFAAGGFSNVWGGVIEPLPRDEFREWPVTLDELSPHYEAVRALVCDLPGADCTGQSQAGETVPELRPSSQAKALYDELCVGWQKLERAGIRFGYAQLGVRTSDQNGSKGCRYCGLCLYGCPYECRYSAVTTLQRLIKDDRVAYIPGIVADRLNSESGHVCISARSLADGTAHSYRARVVLLGAGLLETSRIVLNSLGLYGASFQVKHSDIFTLPLVRYGASVAVVHERLHTLCQLVAEVEDAAICPHPVHLQFYGYNDLHRQMMAQRLGFLAYPLAPVLRGLATRLIVIFGYLHSDVSSTITLTLIDGERPKLRLEGRPNPSAALICRNVARKLFRIRDCLRALPVPFQLRLDLPGGGYHSGGIFPMRHMPGKLETDRLGGLPALPGVHIIDNSIMPTIPAFPTAFTMMANAHRIGSELEAIDEH